MEYSVPTVNLNDLRAFQARHFIVGDHNLPQGGHRTAGYSREEKYQHDDYKEEEDDEDDDDDGLGYYPDGVKRTLTDEQIAIFRHSEIQRLLHERRLQAEREEDELEQGPEGDSNQDTVMVETNTEESPKTQADGGKDNEGNTVRDHVQPSRRSEKGTVGHQGISYEESETTKPVKMAPQPFQRRLVRYDD